MHIKKLKVEGEQRIQPRHGETVPMVMMTMMTFAMQSVEKRIRHCVTRTTDASALLTLIMIGDDGWCNSNR